MPSLRDRYRRLDARVRELSRAKYALTVGAFVFVATLAMSSVLGDFDVFQATTMGAAFTAVYYAMNPNRSDAAE
jgi:hypothetical protein